MNRASVLLGALIVLLALLVWSGANPYDRLTWVLEVAPVVVVVPLLLATYRRFPLTSLLYGLVFLHALVLMLGGAYTYARVPLGEHLAEWFALDRNPYDKIGHFFQGFVPAMVAREILVRGRHVRGRGMVWFVSLSIALAVSAAYEVIEWTAAVVLGQGADEFLGTQGDAWDTQSDMLMAGIGAACSLLLLSRIHDRQIRGMAGETAAS